MAFRVLSVLLVHACRHAVVELIEAVKPTRRFLTSRIALYTLAPPLRLLKPLSSAPIRHARAALAFMTRIVRTSSWL
eukprot:4156327-Pleurochrysis_carterae.AAC.1